MKRFDFYIMKALWRGVLLVLLGLLSVDVFMAMADEMGDIRTGVYEVADALVYVALTIPRRVFEQLPVATLAGTLVGVGGLAASSELVAMRAAGFSRLRMAGSVAMGAALLSLGFFFLSEQVMPWSEQYAHDLKYRLQGERMQQGRPGDVIWLRDRQRFMRVFRVQTGGGTKFLDIRLFELAKDGRPLRLLSATDLETKAEQWVLHGVHELTFADQGTKQQRLDELPMAPMGSARLLEAGVVKPRFLSMADLSAIGSQMEQRGMDNRVYRVAWWVHAINPFTLLVMAVFASSFLHGSLRSGTAGRRLLLGMMLGLAFYMLNRTAANVAQIYALPVGWVVALPTLLVIGWTAWRYRQSGV